VSTRIFPTAQDAENAFYEALERNDLPLMMAVWAEDEDLVCVHPGGARLAGQEPVRESWRKIFASGQRLRFQIHQQVTLSGVMFAVHSVQETITVVGEPRPRPPMAATNVYLRTPSGWRMIVHHSSPAPGAAGEPAPDLPKILH